MSTLPIMWTLASWISVGLVTVLVGALLASPDLDAPAVNFLGYALLVLGGIVAQVGVIGLGVLTGLRARDAD